MVEKRSHFIITRYCPMEEIFDGSMTFTEARKFMDEHASFERRVGFKVFNDSMSRWEDFKVSYLGGRKVYDKNADLYFLDPDYRGMHKPEYQAWHLWCVTSDGSRKFVRSFKSEQMANMWRDLLTSVWKDVTYYVEPSDL